MKTPRKKPANCHIDPILYQFYLRLKDRLGVEMVHRRRRKSSTCIEIIITCDAINRLSGRLNTLPEAEKCGFWIVCRPQTKRGHTKWHDYIVYQLFLTPVHPKKRHDAQLAAVTAGATELAEQQALAEQITFEPILPRKKSLCGKKRRENLHICNFCCTFVPKNKQEQYETYFD